ncbi:putative ferric-chelate reductase 1 [Mercenaria mercenaria]|uniref:putative ferric-chelate reductase 1 n=1 Tax=Mercenaria mercenaria TaxID=6596 RepID=UPI001E1D58C1|nr:putative ferric-chelate reductase 1 [Mercenaria mercenaria]XP_045158959.1 putative ferric-chelate reductase 1 [Mercenaria mercenaria]
MSLFLPLCLVALACFQCVGGFGAGAPADHCGAAATMKPGHGLPSQTSDIPYTLTTVSGQSTYSTGETISLTLAGGTFTGFLIQALSSSSNTIVGTMIAPAGGQSQVLFCGGSGNNGITHTNKVSKSSFNFQWEGPDTTTSGAVTFLVTVVQDYSTYWVKEMLLTLTPAGTGTTLSAISPETGQTTGPQLTVTPLPQTTVVSSSASSPLTTKPSSQGGKIEYDPQCGVVKGCFVDCSGNDCKFMVTWRDLGSAVQFELFGKPDRSFTDAWVAVGFSSDTRMGDDSVTECVYSNGFIQAFSSYNTGYSNPRRLNPPKIGLTNVEGYYLDGVLSCTFVRQKSLPVQGFFDLEQDWHIMFAHGKVLQVPAWQLYMHSTTELPPASAARIDYQSVVVIGSVAKFPLVKAHGCLMIFAWVLFTGIGIVVARYYKSVWADKTFLKLKIWFQVHRACMATALGLNVVAFILIFIEVKGYSDIPDIPGKGYLRSHPILGIIVTILCLANPVMAFFRPGPDHNKRPLFNWAHWGVGMTAYILSAICICFGFQLGKSSTPDYAIYIMIVYVLYIIIFDVVFEVMEFISKKEKKGELTSIYETLRPTSSSKYNVARENVKVEGMEMSTRNGTDNGAIPNGNHVTKDKIKKTDKVKTMLLALHIAFTGAFALVLVLVVALN